MRKGRTDSAVSRGRTVVLVLLVLIHGLLAYSLADEPLKGAALNAVLFAVEIAIGLFNTWAVAVLAAGIVSLALLDLTTGGEGDPTGPGPAAGHSLLEIQTPQPDAAVDGVVAIRAVTRLQDGFSYYAYVATDGSESVAASLRAATGGSEVSGSVRLGNAAVGPGLVYRIYVLASPESLPIGSSHVPSNVIWSAAITVVRRAG
jgi:hypothetical protein